LFGPVLDFFTSILQGYLPAIPQYRECHGIAACFCLFYKSAHSTITSPTLLHCDEIKAAKELNCADLPK
jgi:hypothetical protein